MSEELTKAEDRLAEAIASEESPDTIVTLARSVVSQPDFMATVNQLRTGANVSIPVDVGQPRVTPESLAADKAEHAAAVQKAVAANRAIIQGVAVSIVAASSAALGGTSAIAAFIPAAKAIIDAIASRKKSV